MQRLDQHGDNYREAPAALPYENQEVWCYVRVVILFALLEYKSRWLAIVVDFHLFCQFFFIPKTVKSCLFFLRLEMLKLC